MKEEPCFEDWYGDLKHHFEQWKYKNKGTDTAETISVCYSEFYERHQVDLGHYFRTLYHLIKFVKSTDIDSKYESQRRYTSLARAQLSACELAMLFYNGLSPAGEKFKPLIEEFGLLENLDKRMLLDRSHDGFYSDTAFK